MKINKPKPVHYVIFSFMGIILIALIVGNVLCAQWSNQITSLLCGDGTSFNGEHVQNALSKGKELVENINNEGIVLLKNENNTLPLSKNETNVNFLELINKLPFLLLLIALYMVISSMLIFALNSLGISKIYLSFIELSNGCNILINSFSQISYLLLVLLISFNGFCIHMQVATILNNQKMYKTFFYGRFLSMIITFIIYFFAIFFLKYT